MNCREIDPKLYLYADGELAAEEKPGVEEHLSECANCQTLLAALHRENEIISAAAIIPSWNSEQLVQLEKQLLAKTKVDRPFIWQEFPGLVKEALWLGALAAVLCLVMQAFRFNPGFLYEWIGVESLTAACKSLSLAQFYIAGSTFLFFLFKYRQSNSFSKSAL
jgi:hypothetical protein